MKTIKFAAILAAMLFCSSFLMAQNQGGGPREAMTNEQRAQMIAQRLKSELSLSDQQTQQLQAIYLDSFNKEQQIANERMENMRKVLTPDQLDKLRQSEQMRAQRFGQGGGPMMQQPAQEQPKKEKEGKKK